MKRHVFAALLLGTLLPLPISHAQTAQQALQQPPSGIAAVTKVPELSNEQLDKWSDKLNTYVKLYNDSSRALESWRYYKSWVNVKTGPTGKERYVNGLYSLPDDLGKELAPKAINASKAEPAMGALDKAAAEHAAAVIQLAPIAKEAYTYYHRKDYTDDKLARGKELHPTLVETFEAVERTRAVFDAELTSVKAQVDQQLLNQIEKTEGRKYRWHSRRVMMASLKAVEALQAVRSKDDLPAFSEAVKAYAVIVREFDDYRTAAPTTDLPKFGLTMKTEPDSLLAKLREARDALEKNNTSLFNSYAESAISTYNSMVRFRR